MEEKINNKEYSFVLRQAPLLLVVRIIIAEILIMILNWLLRFILSTLSSYMITTLPTYIYAIEIVMLQLFNLYLLLSIVLQWANTYYILNPREVIIKRGVFSVQSTTYEFANLQSMSITQTIFERLFNYGTIRLYNPVLKEEVYLSHIPNPVKYGEIIQQHQPEITPLIKKRK